MADSQSHGETPIADSQWQMANSQIITRAGRLGLITTGFKAQGI
jgi:hypothetical protein